MQSLKLGFEMLCKRLSFSVALIVQLTIVIVLSQMMIGKINFATFSLNAFSNFEKQIGVYYCPILPDEKGEISKIKGITDVLTIDNVAFCTERETFPVRIYDDKLLELYNPNRKQLSGEDNASYISAISSDEKLKLGTVLKGYLTGDDGQQTAAELQVNAQFASPHIPMEFGVGGNTIRTGDLFMPPTGSAPVLLIAKSSLQGEMQTVAENANRLLLFDSEEAMEQGTKILKKTGMVNPIQNIVHNEKDTVSKQFKVMTPYFVLCLLMTLIGLFGLSFLTIIQNLRTFATYFIVGCSQKTCLRICQWYVVLLIGISGILSIPIVIWLFSDSNLYSIGIFPNWLNIIAPFSLFAILMLLSVASVTVLFRKYTLTQVLRRF